MKYLIENGLLNETGKYKGSIYGLRSVLKSNKA